MRVPEARKVSCRNNFWNHYLMDISVLCWIKSLNYLWWGLLRTFTIKTLCIFLDHLELMPSLIWGRLNLDMSLLSSRKSFSVKHRVITVLNWYRVDLSWSKEIYLILRSLRQSGTLSRRKLQAWAIHQLRLGLALFQRRASWLVSTVIIIF